MRSQVQLLANLALSFPDVSSQEQDAPRALVPDEVDERPVGSELRRALWDKARSGARCNDDGSGRCGFGALLADRDKRLVDHVSNTKPVVALLDPAEIRLPREGARHPHS